MYTANVNIASASVPIEKRGDVISLQASQDRRVTEAESVIDSVKYNNETSSDKLLATVLQFSLPQEIHFQSSTAKVKSAQASAYVQGVDAINTAQIEQNIVQFVETSIANFSAQELNDSEIAAFKTQAIEGVRAGFNTAQQELIRINAREMLPNLDESMERVVDLIDKLPSQASQYISPMPQVYEAIDLFSNTGSVLRIMFGDAAFSQVEGANQRSITSSSTNLSYKLSSDDNETALDEATDYVNKVDDLVNSFFRTDVQTEYRFDENDLAQIPESVAEYSKKFENIMSITDDLFSSRSDFKALVNGIVNQMADVQVPDLIQAINRFHSFNRQFE